MHYRADIEADFGAFSPKSKQSPFSQYRADIEVDLGVFSPKSKQSTYHTL